MICNSENYALKIQN